MKVWIGLRDGFPRSVVAREVDPLFDTYSGVYVQCIDYSIKR